MPSPEPSPSFKLRAAELRDVQPIVGLIRELAEFEQLTHLLQVTPEKLRPHLFGERPVAEAMVAEIDDGASKGEVAAFALFFTNFSTFLALARSVPGGSVRAPHAPQAGHRPGAAAQAGRAGRGTRLRPLRMVGARAGTPMRSVLHERMGATVMPDWRICRVTGDALRDLGGGKA